MTLDEKLDKLLDVVGHIEWRLDRLDDVLLPRIENRLGGILTNTVLARIYAQAAAPVDKLEQLKARVAALGGDS